MSGSCPTPNASVPIAPILDESSVLVGNPTAGPGDFPEITCS